MRSHSILVSTRAESNITLGGTCVAICGLADKTGTDMFKVSWIVEQGRFDEPHVHQPHAQKRGGRGVELVRPEAPHACDEGDGAGGGGLACTREQQHSTCA